MLNVQLRFRLDHQSLTTTDAVIVLEGSQSSEL